MRLLAVHPSALRKETIAKVAQILAPQQQERLVVNGYTDNAPVGPTLQNQGITSNQICRKGVPMR